MVTVAVALPARVVQSMLSMGADLHHFGQMAVRDLRCCCHSFAQNLCYYPTNLILVLAVDKWVAAACLEYSTCTVTTAVGAAGGRGAGVSLLALTQPYWSLRAQFQH